MSYLMLSLSFSIMTIIIKQLLITVNKTLKKQLMKIYVYMYMKIISRFEEDPFINLHFLWICSWYCTINNVFFIRLKFYEHSYIHMVKSFFIWHLGEKIVFLSILIINSDVRQGCRTRLNATRMSHISRSRIIEYIVQDT